MLLCADGLRSRAGCPGRSAGLLSRPRYRRTPRLHQGHRLHRRRPVSGFGLRRQDDPHLGLAEPARRIRTLRGFVGPGNDGKIFAVAVSPDGKTIAAGGYFGAGLGDKPPYGDIRLFDFATGKVKATLKAADYAIYDLAFSPDGSFLAAGGQDGFVYVWQARRGGSDRLESRSPGSTPIPGISSNWPLPMAATGWSPTTTDNGIRLWDMPAGTEIAHARRRAAARPAGDGAGGIGRRRAVCDRQQ